MDSCINTLQISARSRECFTSSRKIERGSHGEASQDDVGEYTTCQQSRLGHTHSTGWMQSLAISG
jgi:hypothetical protein